MAQSGGRARKYLQKQCLASIWFVYRYDYDEQLHKLYVYHVVGWVALITP
jgi:hypothetical protein